MCSGARERGSGIRASIGFFATGEGVGNEHQLPGLGANSSISDLTTDTVQRRHPIFRISPVGEPELVAFISLKGEYSTFVEWITDSPWPLDEEARDGSFDGLPYFLQDMRPAGFLGKEFADTYATTLQLSGNPDYWTDAEVLFAISEFGVDTIGDLLVGETALQRWHLLGQNDSIGHDSSGLLYERLAKRKRQTPEPITLASGVNPKFTTTRIGDTQRQVIVKYAGGRSTPALARWADLLVCEHLAAQTIRSSLHLEAVDSQVVEFNGATFLECARFDRHSYRGRSSVLSWEAINYGIFGNAGLPWPEGTLGLLDRCLIEESTFRAIVALWYFGQLIGNSDMHDGNLSFRTESISASPVFRLAPVYDMLPMTYAPSARGLRETPIRLSTAAPEWPVLWEQSRSAAHRFWAQAAVDSRITAEFRSLCGRNADLLKL